MEQCERAKQQGVHAEGIERADIHVQRRGGFLLGKVIAFDKLRGILAIALALSRISIDVIKQFLQLIETHLYASSFLCSQGMTVSNTKGMLPMWPPGKRRIVLGLPCSDRR